MEETSRSTFEWFRPELTLLPLRAETAAEAITRLAARLIETGCVQPSYLAAALERERTYPTGLPDLEIGVAIPHAGSQHVIRPAIAVGILPAAVPFGEMGSPPGSATISVQAVFLLAIDSGRAVTPVLRRLVTAFQAPGLLRQFAASPNGEALIRLLRAHIPSGELGYNK